MADAPGSVVGTAVLQVVPSMKGGIKGLEDQLGGAGSQSGKKFTGGFQKATSGIGKMLSKTLKGGALAVGAAGAAGIGTALTQGFKRLDAIDKAEAKLKGLGHTSGSVEKIMGSALNSVKGTAFGLGDAATVAATTVAAGVKPGKELQRTLTIIGDSATIAGVGMDEMGSIFNKVAAGGKLTTETMQQMQERGIPVMQFLSKETGKSVAEVQKDLSAGKIDFETFQTAMEKNLGGAAQESGKTFSGAMANMKAALGRLGASFMSPLFESGPGILTTLTNKLDLLGPVAEKAGNMVSSGMGKMGSFFKNTFTDLDIGKRLNASFTEARGGLRAFVAAFKAGGNDITSNGFAGVMERIGLVLRKGFDVAQKALAKLAPHIKTFGRDMLALWPAVQGLAKQVGSFLLAAFRAVQPYLKSAAVIIGVALVAAMKVLPPALKAVFNAFGWLLDTIKPLLPLVASLTAMFITYKGVMAVGYLLQGVGAFMAMTRAQKLAAIATKAQTAAQWALNLAMKMNPVGAIIAIVMVLVGTLIYLYKNNESVRKGIDAAWAKIKSAFKSTIDWFTKTAWPALRGAFNAIVGFVKRIPGYFRTAGSGIKTAWSKVSGWVMAPIRFAGKWIGRYIAGWKFIFSKAIEGIRIIWNKAKSIVMAPIRWAGRWISRSVAGWKLIFSRARSAISKIWDRVRNVIMTPIRWVGNWVKRSVLGWRLIFSRARDLIRRIWSRIREFVMSPIRSAVDWVKKKIDQVRTGFAIMRDRARAVWSRMNEFVRAPIRKGVDWVKQKIDTFRGMFARVRDALGKVWDKMYGKIQSPFKKARTWINDKFIHGINKLLGKVGIKADTFRVPKIAGFATGGWTGSGGKYTPAGVVHKDEFVLRKEATNKLRRSIGLGGLNYMNQTGQMPGYASGGYVYPKMVEWIKRAVPNAAITSTKRNWGTGSYHDIGKAIDIGGSAAVMRRAAQAIKSAFGSRLAELIHNPGFSMKNGRSVPASFWGGGTWAGHADHVHWAMESMSGGLIDSVAKFGDMFSDGDSWFEEKVKGGLNKIIGKFSQPGAVGKLIPAILKKITNGVTGLGGKVVNGAKSKLAGLYDKVNGTDNMDFSSVGKFVTGSGVERWRNTVRRALWMTGNSPSLADITLKKMMQESGGNPNAVNRTDINAKRGDPSKGLMQVIGSTFRAYAHPEHNRNIFDPLSNILASMRYAKATYGSLQSAYGRSGGYADGGLVKPMLFDSGGYLPEGISLVENRTGKPEPLKRMDGAETPHVTVYVQSPWGPQYMESKVREVVEDENNYASTIRRMN